MAPPLLQLPRPAANASGQRASSAPHYAQVQMTGGNTILHLQGELLGEALAHTTRRELIDRLFTLPGLQLLHLNPKLAKARLHFAEPQSRPKVLAELAAALRRNEVPRLPLAHEHLLLDETPLDPIEVHRLGRELTFWRIDIRNPSHYRLWHPLLRSEIVRQQVLEEFAALPDVVRQAPSYLHHSAIHIWVRPHRIDPAHLLEILDPVLAEYMASPKEIARQPFKEALINTNLALAPISDFVFPPLGVANALLVGTINRNHLVPAFRNLRKGKADLHLLYLSIGTMTLLTFSFTGAAVMYWLLLFWPRKAKQLRQRHENAFLASYRRRPRQVWVEEKGAVIEARVQELTPRSLIVLKPGDIVPGDGVVVSGEARIDDHRITGVMTPAAKIEGAPVYASSRVLDGELRIRVPSFTEETAAARIAAWYAENLKINPEHQSLRAKEQAEATVLPMLLLGLVGLYRGGLHMAKAAIRPDYLTGPMVAEDLVDLSLTMRTAQQGILLANASSLTALAGCDCLILDDSVAWNAAGLENIGLAERLRQHGISEIAFLSGQASGTRSKADFDVIRHNFSTEDKRAYIAQRQHFDHTVAYIGDCQAEAPVAAQADLAVSVLTPPHVTPHGTQAALLGADLIKIVHLLDLVQASRAEFSNAFGLTLAPNAAATLGALYLHTHVEASVILSNLGTLANYLRYRSMLRSNSL